MSMNQVDENQFIGTWTSENDSDFKIRFEAEYCSWYSGNDITEEYYYEVSNSSPQCGKEVFIDSNTSYLKMSNMADPNDIICYEIYGFTEKSNTKTLSLRPLGRGGYLIFTMTE